MPRTLTVRLKAIYAGGPSGDGFYRREWVDGELDAIRERGYGVSDREVGSNTRTFAVPVLARSGATLAAVDIVVRPTTTTLNELVDVYAARYAVHRGGHGCTPLSTLKLN